MRALRRARTARNRPAQRSAQRLGEHHLRDLSTSFSILLKTIGPKAVLERQLRGLQGLNRALIYGSRARRYRGEPGPLPQDVDLMVIGTADVAAVRARTDSASRELGRDVNATVLAPDEWETSPTGFVAHLKAEPLVELDLLR